MVSFNGRWPTRWGDFENGDIARGPLSGSDAYAELSRFVPQRYFSSIFIVNSETETLEAFWARPKNGSRSSGFEAVYDRYYEQFCELFRVARSHIGNAESMRWEMLEGESSIFVFRIRKCILYGKINKKSIEKEKFLVTNVANALDVLKSYVLTNIVGEEILNRQIFSITKFEEKVIFERYFGPLMLEPLEAGIFIWPWQYGMDGADLEKRAIPTTTIVFDLRNSTSSYSQASNKVSFAKWTHETKLLVKSIIIDHGGVYSMDTGDGVVGHFCQPISSALSGKGAITGNNFVDAVSCGWRIVTEIGARCDQYKDSMIQRLEGLDASAAIHHSEAIWVNIGGVCQAVGMNVISATRMCNAAPRGTLIFSQVVKNGLEMADEQPPTLPKISLLPLDVKEVPERAELHCYKVDRSAR